MSSDSFHMALFEPRAARIIRRSRENHANGRILLAGAADRLAGREPWQVDDDAVPFPVDSMVRRCCGAIGGHAPGCGLFTDHSRADRCQCESARGGAAHPIVTRVQPDAEGLASGTNFPR